MSSDDADPSRTWRVAWLGDAAEGPPDWVGSAWGPLVAEPGDASQSTADTAADHDAVVFTVGGDSALQALASRPELSVIAVERPVIVVAPAPHDASAVVELMARGVQDVVAAGNAELLARAVRLAIERKALERTARHAYATDLATGLPHQAQLLEHMSQLLALREREPSPMVLIVLRVDGIAAISARLGFDAGGLLRRKLAVRLRSGLRAGDVVASMGHNVFGVLLGHVEAGAHGDRVARKLASALQQPLSVAGQSCSVSVSAGLALYPDHGKDAESLLRRASAQALSVATVGAEGFAARDERSHGAAANDEPT